MTHRGEHIYASDLTDIEGRNAEVAALKASLAEEHGEGQFTARRVNADRQPAEFGDRILWAYRV